MKPAASHRTLTPPQHDRPCTLLGLKRARLLSGSRSLAACKSHTYESMLRCRSMLDVVLCGRGLPEMHAGMPDRDYLTRRRAPTVFCTSQERKARSTHTILLNRYHAYRRACEHRQRRHSCADDNTGAATWQISQHQPLTVCLVTPACRIVLYLTSSLRQCPTGA